MNALGGFCSNARGGFYKYDKETPALNEAGCFYINSKKYGEIYAEKFKKLHEEWGLSEGPIEKVKKN